MRKVRKFLGITAWLAAIMLLVLACSDDLDIRTRYIFDLETMPVQKRVIEGETVEIRCRIVKEGDYKENRFYIRFFQPDGQGSFRLDNGRILLPNDLYPLKNEVFRLYYTSGCTDQQSIDVYIVDSFGQTVQKTFSWQNESVEEEE
ncbi:MAG: hypothetical protein EZS26_003940 [Candidatus Ordinivivax streblomastigis]|uniref:DUF3872 domain-containing protein n=1 Tax=Candidatus Ordinivivax streblomastigis TaxID=2540710 RepID=A0A5M8NSR8_9BACT|nr:MAG: hypothetical protein EZS26_003940 [Candidatus Ordinivivax streblomastigis]